MVAFQVQNLGKVRSGHITLAPLTILVGKNNTGKSYIASLIWALSSLRRLHSRPDARGRRPKWFTELLELSTADPEREVHIDHDKADDVLRHINDVFRRSGADFLSTIFAYEGFRETRVSVTSGSFKPFTVRMSVVTGTSRGRDRDEVHCRFVGEQDNPLISIHFPMDLWREAGFFSDMIFDEIVNSVIHGRIALPGSQVLYIPAARTGLMLALSSLVSEGLDVKESSSVKDLPQPLVSFLRSMARPQKEPRGRSVTKLASWLRDNVTRGSIKAQRTPSIPEYRYVPEGMDMELPLHATSSMITELAPFLVSLDAEIRGRHLILEEPEAHLHLEAQREMARAIARMVSLGAQITLTTHSDTFLQQINNLITLHDHPRRAALMKRFHYEKSDLIDPSKVAAFEFEARDEGTHIQEIKRGSEGFVVRTLNETLLALAQETLAIREK